MEKLKFSSDDILIFLKNKNEDITGDEMEEIFGSDFRSQIIGYYDGNFQRNLFSYLKNGIALFQIIKGKNDTYSIFKSRMINDDDLRFFNSYIGEIAFEMEHSLDKENYEKWERKRELIEFILENQKMRRIFL